jgi:geranylgeranyl reductase family protein
MILVRPAADDECDVAIVGAGPAGAATAARLAGYGLDVVLIDHKRFPRDKVCGDFVGALAIVELAALGVTKTEAYRRSNVIREAALHLDGAQLIHQSFPVVPGAPGHGRVVPRMQLDEWILGAAIDAGATIRDGVKVLGFDRDARGVVLSLERDDSVRTLRARALVGADGSNSQIARLLRGRNLSKDRRIIAVRGYYRGIHGPAARADLYFSARSFPGYYWLFPIGPHEANVGVGMVRRTVPPTAEHLRKLLLDLVEDDPALRGRIGTGSLDGKIVGWPLTTYDPRAKITGDRTLLVGDAAGLINPLNGEGIQYALQSARWASETLVARLADDRLSARALAPYARQVQSGLRYDMALAQMIVQLIRNRSLNDVWLRALRILISRSKVDPQFAHVAGGVLAGLLPASDVVSRRVLLGTLEQAAVSVGIDASIGLFRARRRLAGLGVPPARFGYQVAFDSVSHPGQVAGWAASVAGSAAELATQVAINAIAKRAEPAAQSSRSTM